MKELFWVRESKLMSGVWADIACIAFPARPPPPPVASQPQFSWHFTLFSLWFLFVLKYTAFSKPAFHTSCCYPVPRFSWHFHYFPLFFSPSDAVTSFDSHVGERPLLFILQQQLSKERSKHTHLFRCVTKVHWPQGYANVGWPFLVVIGYEVFEMC